MRRYLLTGVVAFLCAVLGTVFGLALAAAPAKTVIPLTISPADTSIVVSVIGGQTLDIRQGEKSAVSVNLTNAGTIPVSGTWFTVTTLGGVNILPLIGDYAWTLVAGETQVFAWELSIDLTAPVASGSICLYAVPTSAAVSLECP